MAHGQEAGGWVTRRGPVCSRRKRCRDEDSRGREAGPGGRTDGSSPGGKEVTGRLHHSLTGCSRSTIRRLLRLGTKTTSTNLRMRNISWLILAAPVTKVALGWSHLAISCCFSVRCMRPFFSMMASSTPRITSSAILST